MRTKFLLTPISGKQLLFVAIGLLMTSVSIAQTWTPKAAVTGNANEYDGPIHFAVNNKIYVGGGLYGISLKEYDPTANTWTAKGTLPGSVYSRSGAASFTINGKGYMGLGFDFNSGTFDYDYLSDMQEYNPTTNIWTAKASFPGTPRTAVACFVVNNKAYIVGGNDSTGGLDEVWEFDPAANTWTQKADYPAGLITYACGFSIGTKGYIALGNLKVGTSPYAVTKKLFEFDPIANTWTAKTDYPGSARSAGTAFTLNNKGYVGMGASVASQVSYTHYDDFYTYDPTTGWGPAITSFPGNPRQLCMSDVLGNKAYVGTGWTFINGSNTYYNDFYEFSTTTSVANTVNAVDIICFPNPAKDILYIQQPQQTGKVTYEIFNTLGQKVLSGNLTDNTINISGFTTGQYYLALYSDNQKYFNTHITIEP